MNRKRLFLTNLSCFFSLFKVKFDFHSFIKIKKTETKKNLTNFYFWVTSYLKKQKKTKTYPNIVFQQQTIRLILVHLNLADDFRNFSTFCKIDQTGRIRIGRRFAMLLIGNTGHILLEYPISFFQKYQIAQIHA